jgi:hypothetical protein
MNCAVLVHAIDWESSSPFHEIDHGITLHKTTGSKVEALYHNLCENHNIDQGEPFTYHFHVLFNGAVHQYLLMDIGGRYSIITKLCNIIVICLSYPLDMCRMIVSADNFETAFVPPEIIYDSIYGDSELDILRLHPDRIDFGKDGSISYSVDLKALNDVNLKEIQNCWINQKALNDCHRIANALSYFFYSWHSFYLDHVCLNLAITLESLFSRSSTTELSHRIAFNFSRMHGKNYEERQSDYKLIRKFYNLRSSIVHGGIAKDEELYRIVPHVFHLTANILKRILMDKELSSFYRDEKKLNQLFDQWLFT